MAGFPFSPSGIKCVERRTMSVRLLQYGPTAGKRQVIGSPSLNSNFRLVFLIYINCACLVSALPDAKRTPASIFSSSRYKRQTFPDNPTCRRSPSLTYTPWNQASPIKHQLSSPSSSPPPAIAKCLPLPRWSPTAPAVSMARASTMRSQALSVLGQRL